MGCLFWGFLLAFLNFNLSWDGGSLNLLPAFAGYLLLWRAARQLREESPLFSPFHPLALILAAYSFGVWVMDLLGMGNGQQGLVWYLLFLTEAACRLYLAYRTVRGIQDMERRRNCGLRGTELYRIWVNMVDCTAVLELTRIIAAGLGYAGADANWLAAVSAAVVFLVSVLWVIALVLFLIDLWKAKSAWAAVCPPEPEK